MKIFFDISPLTNGHQGRGIGVYTRNLIKALSKYKTVGVQSGNIDEGGFECDIIHYPYFDFFSQTLPIRKRTKTVVTIHDTIPLIYQKQINPGIRGIIKHYFQRLSLLNVSAVITDSQNSKVDINKYLKVQNHKIFVTPLALNQDFAKTSQKKIKNQLLPKKYLLYVGDINYNKNLPSLIKAFTMVNHKNLELVIVSRALNQNNIPESEAIIQEISHSLKKGKIHILTNVDKKTLPNIYQNAWFYIQPSLYEGFGLPILEAFHSKTPVLCSNTSSLPEVAGNAAIYFDPSTPENIMNAITQALKLTTHQRQELIQKGSYQLSEFSWQNTARETINVYKKVLAI